MASKRGILFLSLVLAYWFPGGIVPGGRSHLGSVAQASEFPPNQVCIVFLVREPEYQKELSKIMLAHVGIPIRVFYSVRNLRACLSGAYTDSIIVSHSMNTPDGLARMIYQQQLPGGSWKWTFFNERVFRGFEPGASLRTVTLLTCNADRVLKAMPALDDFAAVGRVRVTAFQTDARLEQDSGVSGIRSVRQLVDILREIAHPLSGASGT